MSSDVKLHRVPIGKLLCGIVIIAIGLVGGDGYILWVQGERICSVDGAYREGGHAESEPHGGKWSQERREWAGLSLICEEEEEEEEEDNLRKRTR